MSMLTGNSLPTNIVEKEISYNIYPDPNAQPVAADLYPKSLLHERFPYSHYSIAKLYGSLRREVRGVWNRFAEEIINSPNYSVVRMARELNIQVEAVTKILIGKTHRPRFETSLRLLCLHIMLFPNSYEIDGENIVALKPS